MRALRGFRIALSPQTVGGISSSTSTSSKAAISGGVLSTGTAPLTRVDCLIYSRRAMSSSSSSSSVKVFYDSQSGQSMTVTTGLVRLHER